MHLGYGNLSAFYYAINLARQLSQYLYSLQNWDAPKGSRTSTNFKRSSKNLTIIHTSGRATE